jgi:predicted RNA-binding protein (TIGR00451 family)
MTSKKHPDTSNKKRPQLEVSKAKTIYESNPIAVPLYILNDVIDEVIYPLFYEALPAIDKNKPDEKPKPAVLIPHLKLVHRFPECFPTIRCDRGAIRFVLSGAPMMAPGLTSVGGRLPDPGNKGEDAKYGTDDINKGKVVVIEAEGKENACMVGILNQGTKEMKEKKKDAALEGTFHFLGDGLWKLPLE